MSLAAFRQVLRDGSFGEFYVDGHRPDEWRHVFASVDSLEAALWAFAKSTSFEHGALLAVNLGDDADTTGAVYGQIAGAFYGADAVPERWRSKLALSETLESCAMRLMKKEA